MYVNSISTKMGYTQPYIRWRYSRFLIKILYLILKVITDFILKVATTSSRGVTDSYVWYG